jgi:HEAT repeat protein
MTLHRVLSYHPFRSTDVDSLIKKQDVRGLVRLLSYPDFTIQWRAAEGLGKLGQKALPRIVGLSRHPDPAVRLGMTEALADIGDPSAIPVLEKMLIRDESEEVRWAAAITLGEIGDPQSIVPLVHALRDGDKYVRYGAALALRKMGWEPSGAEETLLQAIAGNSWDKIRSIPDLPIEPLIAIMEDRDPAIRINAFESLSALEKPVPARAAAAVLKDSHPAVRQCAVRELPGCGFSPLRLPKGVAKRVKDRKSPFVAAMLNFLFLGLGFNYLGRWWGFLLFQVDATAILLLSLATGSLIPYLISYSLSAVVAVYTWYLVKFEEILK